MSTAFDQSIAAQISETTEALRCVNTSLAINPFHWRLTHAGQECLREKHRLLAQLETLRRESRS
jgi:hypothetical protein